MGQIGVTYLLMKLVSIRWPTDKVSHKMKCFFDVYVTDSNEVAD